jgi:multiple sugar transport system permease protein
MTGWRLAGRVATYAILLLWAFICVFPLYWTVTTSFKSQFAIYRGPTYIPWVDFTPVRLGWDAVLQGGMRQEFIHDFTNSLLFAVVSGILATVLGAMAGYGLARFNYKFGPWRNRDISLWFVSQLILPPAAVVMPMLILYRDLHLLDTRTGMILLYTVVNLPIVVWIMRDQFASISVELEQAAQVDGATLFGAFTRIVVPISLPGLVASFILCAILSWNEYFFAAVLTSYRAVTIPFLIAGQVSSQGVQWWAMAALSTAAVLPLAIIGIALERYIVKGLTAGAVK